MTDISNLSLNQQFDYRSVSIENLSFDTPLKQIDFNEDADIYVKGETPSMSLREKYEKLNDCNGYIHFKGGLSLEMSNGRIKSLRISDKYIRQVNVRKRQDIELELGKPDQEMTDGIMWGVEYSIDAKVLFYKKLKLYLHIDPETDELTKIHFGDVDERMYD